jgi:hypothetical protein
MLSGREKIGLNVMLASLEHVTIKEQIDRIHEFLKGGPQEFWSTLDAENIIVLLGEAATKLKLAKAVMDKIKEGVQ